MKQDTLKFIQKSFVLLTCVTVVSMFATFLIHANIGMGSVEALNSSMGLLTGIKIGTVAVIVNVFLILLQIIILCKEFQLIQLLQLPIVLLQGTIINFFLYEILHTVQFDSYTERLIIVIVCSVVNGIMLGLLAAIQFISFPLEAACLAIHQKMNWDFGKVRFSFDIFNMLFSLAISLYLSSHLNVREGTIISGILFSLVIGYSYQFFKRQQWVQRML